MNKKQEIPDLIVSVESRKGGVGKTTAALCMARQLLKMKYAVLVLDLDVTGTNAADIADSPFWVDDLHIIQEFREIKDEDTPKKSLNLIKLFDQRFMAGKTIPQFSTKGTSSDTLQVDFTKVNVLGSHIFKTDKEGNNNIGATSIERPGILFDDLHTLWLLELVKQISSDFVRAGHSNKSTKYAVILDNSPGYVGIAPAIHEWLTDLGPESGKFLTVTSLDKQDLLACNQAISTLHSLFKDKWQTSLLFMDSGNKGDGINIDRTQEAFFMRLATSINDNVESVDSLAFYRGTKVDPLNHQQGEKFYDNPSEYIAAIINRVPRSVKDGYLDYETPSVSPQDGNVLARILNNRDGNKDWHDRMISYDEYIENQFLLQSLSRGRGRYLPHVHHLMDVIKMAEEELRIRTSKNSDVSVWYSEMDYRHQKMLGTQLNRANNIVSRVRLAIEDEGLGHLARLIHDKWLPGSIVPNFQHTLSMYLRESDSPYFEMKLYESDHDSTDMDAGRFVSEFKKRIRMELKHFKSNAMDANKSQTFDVLLNVLSNLVILSVPSSLWHSPVSKELPVIFAGVLSIELKHWANRDEKMFKRISIQRFLAQESISLSELREDHGLFESLRFFRRHRMDEGEIRLVDFYKVCTTSQARLIDFMADSQFLLQLFQFIVKGEIEKGNLFPFVRGIAEDVIVTKTLLHEDAPAKMAKAMQSAEYFKEFDGVLNEILKGWGLMND